MVAFEKGGGDVTWCSSVYWGCIETLRRVWQGVGFCFDCYRIFHSCAEVRFWVCGPLALYSGGSILIVCLCMTTLTEVFPCFFLSCKANARVKPAKTWHGPQSSKLLCCSMYFLCCSMYFCVVLCIVCFCRSLYCLCVYVYRTTATGWLSNCN